ncbi:MAG: SDR family oxidoreductase [Candidatus Binatia bacterium]|nr:SDR family oxidoreductase [Candidatus Binatia bacterium]
MARLESFAGIRAVVTGASSGIGELLAKRFAREGAAVALVARRRGELERVAQEIRNRGGQALVLPCDVARRDEVFAAAERVVGEFGGVDLLVNNAGYGGHRPFLEWDIDDIEHIMQVNYFGTVYWTKALLPRMIEQRRGWIVMMASVAGKLGVPDESAYAATKFAQVGLAEALSYEVEDFGVHVLIVCPGAIDTPFFNEAARRRMPEVAKRLMIPPERVVDAVVRALRAGKREITVPPFIRASYVVRALAPGILRRNTKRVAMPPSA